MNISNQKSSKPGALPRRTDTPNPRYAIFGFFSLCIAFASPAHAISFTANPTLSNSVISFETSGVPNGTTVQFSVDTAGQAEVDFFQISSVDQSVAQVSALTQPISAGTNKIFWNGLWNIGADQGRHDGGFGFRVVVSSASSSISDPPVGDPRGQFQITSVDIHNVSVVPSLDGNRNPTFPYAIQYALAKEALVTATITNSTGTLVRTLFANKLQAGESVSTQTWSWNGLNDQSQVVPIGVYTVTVSAVDTANGDRAIPRSRNVAVVSLAGASSDPQKAFEDNVYVYPNPIRNGTATFNVLPIRDGAVITLRVYTISGDLVFDKDITAQLPRFDWDVTNQAGNKLGRGLYFYELREKDSQGTLQTVKKMAVIQ